MHIMYVTRVRRVSLSALQTKGFRLAFSRFNISMLLHIALAIWVQVLHRFVSSGFGDSEWYFILKLRQLHNFGKILLAPKNSKYVYRVADTGSITKLICDGILKRSIER